MTAPLTASAATHPCGCVKNHSPKVNRTHGHHIWPLGWGGPDIKPNVVYICPTTHSEVHLILEAFERAGAVVPKKRAWGAYAYDLAFRGWQMHQEG